jgi:hypothetical protein
MKIKKKIPMQSGSFYEIKKVLRFIVASENARDLMFV